MHALDVIRPFAALLAALAHAFAAPRRPPDVAWDDPDLLDDRQRADVGLGPGDAEPRLRRGGAPAPIGSGALPTRDCLGL